MLVSYTLECGHVYNYMRHVKLKDGKRWCRKCNRYQKVIHIQKVPSLSTLGIFNERRKRSEVLTLPKVRQQIREKAFRSREQAGIYDPMEQAGHRDVIYVSSVFEVLDGLVQQLQKLYDKKSEANDIIEIDKPHVLIIDDEGKKCVMIDVKEILELLE